MGRNAGQYRIGFWPTTDFNRYTLMKLFKEKNWKPPQKPLKAAIIMFSCIALLFLITIPFIDKDGRVEYIFGGLSYSLFLSYSGIGISLLKGNSKKVFIKLFFPVLGGVFSILLILLIIAFLASKGVEPQKASDAMEIVSKVGFYLLIPVGVVIALLPVVGWREYFKEKSV